MHCEFTVAHPLKLMGYGSQLSYSSPYINEGYRSFNCLNLNTERRDDIMLMTLNSWSILPTFSTSSRSNKKL